MALATRRTPRRTTRKEAASLERGPAAHVFPTQLGWMAVVGRQGRLTRVLFDLPSREAAQRVVAALDATPRAWNADLSRRLRDFAAGRRVAFDDVELDLDDIPPFTRRVIDACRAVEYGATSSYADLARAAGSPRAARAVGNAMRTNRWPIVVPCHRILAAGDKLGGFSAPGGLLLKKRLLALEAAARAEGPRRRSI